MGGAGRLLWTALLALGLSGCGDSIVTVSSESASAGGKIVVGSGKTSRDVARQATGAVPQIVNPAEELNEFAPTGLLRWSAVAGADAYELWAYKDAGLTQAAEFSGALSSRQYQFTQLAGGQGYWIKLYFRANGVWFEAPTFQLKTTTNVVKARLSNSQEELEAFAPSGTLRWTAVAGADVYELWIYRDAQLVAFAETSGPVRITQYQITSLAPGTTYYVQIYARLNGQFTAGGALPLTVTDKLDKARIVNPQEELDAFATNGLLRWSPVTGATAYELWIFTNPNVSVIHENSGSLNARSYQTRTLQPGKVYYAQAYALVNGQWQVGAPVKITTTTTPTMARLTTPQEQLEAFATNGTLRWSEVPGATAYELWIYSNAGLGKIVESGANPDRSYTTRRLCSGATYYVQVYALVNGVWTTGWATRLDVTQGTSAGDCIPPSPTVKLTPSATDVQSGQSVSLTWSTQFTTGCTAADGWSGARALNGQQTVGPLNRSTVFTLTCTGPSGSTFAQILVTVSIAPADVTSVFVQAYRDRFGLTVPFPAISRSEHPASTRHAWLSTAYVGSQLYRLYLYADGRIESSIRSARRPVGNVRVVVVAINHPSTNIADVLDNLWRDAQDGINQQHREFGLQLGLATPIVQFSNRNVLAAPSEVPNPKSAADVLAFLAQRGITTADFDIAVSLDLDAFNPAGGFAGYGGNFAYMGYYFLKAETKQMLDPDRLRGLASAIYHHEIGHIWGWDHEWTYCAFTSGPQSLCQGFITAPVLFGWIDADGDGVPEMLDSTPYGRL